MADDYEITPIEITAEERELLDSMTVANLQAGEEEVIDSEEVADYEEEEDVREMDWADRAADEDDDPYDADPDPFDFEEEREIE